MYRGYKLDKLSELSEKQFYNEGQSALEDTKSAVQNKLKTVLLGDGSIDGIATQDNWFPQVKADVFISHSHCDDSEVVALAGLFHSMGLRTFVDSHIWGYAEDLLRGIDNEYCFDEYTGLYNYSQRNMSTAHVHAMLSMALFMMIDNAECVIFYDTPNSIDVSEVIKRTHSPWIYEEMTMTRLVRKYPLEHYRPQVIIESKEDFSVRKSLDIKYAIDTSHLTNIDNDMFDQWYKKAQYKKGTDVLDALYNMPSRAV